MKASLVFEQRSLSTWRGRLVHAAQCRDRRLGGSGTIARYDIVENATTGRCMAIVCGGDRRGRRYVEHESLEAAQRAGLRWAARRFERME